ncbi:MAG: DNA-binding protein Alba [Thermofilum sp. ex4484_15]|nr:MAG: DNA-binding protein Alba [Thermofilum sp. ex4484_15]
MSEKPSEGVIYVGSKPTSSYVLAIVTQLSQGSKRVIVKARGRSITRAVDAVELTKRFTSGKVEVKDIKIGSDKVGEPGKERTVSTIEIVLEARE